MLPAGIGMDIGLLICCMFLARFVFTVIKFLLVAGVKGRSRWAGQNAAVFGLKLVNMLLWYDTHALASTQVTPMPEN